jgi:hypothetical protein
MTSEQFYIHRFERTAGQLGSFFSVVSPGFLPVIAADMKQQPVGE